MRIGREQQALALDAGAVAPCLRVGEKEALLGRVAVDPALGLVLQRLLQREVGDLQPADVGDVLAERELAVDLGALDAVEARILALSTIVGRY